MKEVLVVWLLICALSLAPEVAHAQQSGEVQMWLTNGDKSALFEEQKPLLGLIKATGQKPSPVEEKNSIEIDDRHRFQTMDGFGFTLTGGSAQHLAHMDAAKRAQLLKELFGSEGNGIGISYLRISIGSSDLNDHVYSYDDLVAGETDKGLAKFSLAGDRAELIPILKEILAISPRIQILGSPWSAPAWMKTNHEVKGGKLKAEFYGTYANYFVKYIRGMKAEGIKLAAITVQNEPLNDKNTPSMVMLAEEEGLFIRQYLGPAFAAAGIHTKIIVYDHNCDDPDYAVTILRDPAANRFVDGSGFHLYAGEIAAMSLVHGAFPQKNLYFTEFMAVEPTESGRISIAQPVAGTFIGALRNWSRNVLLWNLAANSKFEPHTDNGGCVVCQGAVTIDGNEVTRNLAYYAMAHFSKFVRPGAMRVGSNSQATLPNVAFRGPGGKTVLIVANDGQEREVFRVRYRGKSFEAALNRGAVGTYVW